MKQRIVWLDSLKGFLILLVVVGHSIQEVGMQQISWRRMDLVFYLFFPHDGIFCGKCFFILSQMVNVRE